MTIGIAPAVQNKAWLSEHGYISEEGRAEGVPGPRGKSFAQLQVPIKELKRGEEARVLKPPTPSIPALLSGSSSHSTLPIKVQPGLLDIHLRHPTDLSAQTV